MSRQNVTQTRPPEEVLEGFHLFAYNLGMFIALVGCAAAILGLLWCAYTLMDNSIATRKAVEGLESNSHQGSVTTLAPCSVGTYYYSESKNLFTCVGPVTGDVTTPTK